MTYSQVLEIIEKIRPYNELECNSHGETVALLCDLAHHSDYISEHLYNAVTEALVSELRNYQTNSKIVVTEETHTVQVTDLQWS